MNRMLVPLLAISLLALANTSPMIPRVRGDFAVSNFYRSDFIWSGGNFGSSVSISNASATGAAYQSGLVVYGGNTPNLYSGVMASITCNNPQFLKDMKVTVSITDPSGNTLAPGRIGNVGMLSSPSSQSNDWARELLSMYNLLVGILGSAVPLPTLTNGAPITGTGSDASKVWAEWQAVGWSSSECSHGLSLRFQPDFVDPGVYAVAVQTHAEMWSVNTSGQFAFLTSADSSYSFQYVYNNDANSGNDAGKTFSTALGISLGTYTGLLYGADNVDMYKFDGVTGQTYYFQVPAPQSAKVGVAIYDPSWNYVTGSDVSSWGVCNYGAFTAMSTGSYYAQMSLDGGGGTYAFSITSSQVGAFSITSSPTSLSQAQGNQAYVTYTLQNSCGYSGNVSLSSSSSPGGLTVTFPGNSPTDSVSFSNSGSVSVIVQVATYNASPGQYQLTLTGTGASHTEQITIPVTVTDSCCNQGGGGSLAAGTLITMADGSRVPIQDLQVGMHLMSYGMTARQFVDSTITRFAAVTVHNEMIIGTADGRSLTTDQNPAQKLYVMLPSGSWTLLPVTELKVGYRLFDPLARTWVPITHIHYRDHGTYIMYDIYPTTPGNYIANGYLDPLKD